MYYGRQSNPFFLLFSNRSFKTGAWAVLKADKITVTSQNKCQELVPLFSTSWNQSTIVILVRQLFLYLPRPKKETLPSGPFLSPVHTFPGPPNKLHLSQEFSLCGRQGDPQHGIIGLHRSIGQNWCMTASFFPDTHAEEKLRST